MCSLLYSLLHLHMYSTRTKFYNLILSLLFHVSPFISSPLQKLCIERVIRKKEEEQYDSMIFLPREIRRRLFIFSFQSRFFTVRVF